MSKKKHSRPTAKNSSDNRIIFIGAGVIVVLAVIAAIVFDATRDDPSSELDAPARQAALASEHAPTVGNPNAKVHVVEFLDPACGTCALFYPMVKRWMTEVPGEIRLSVRHVAFHEGVGYVVRLLEASRNQDRYWQTLETLLAHQSQWVENHVVQPDKVGSVIAILGLDMARLEADMNSEAVLRRIEKDREDAITLKVSATPEYFVNGRQLPSFGQQQLVNLIREELER